MSVAYQNVSSLITFISTVACLYSHPCAGWNFLHECACMPTSCMIQSLVHQLCSHLVCYSNSSGCKCSKRGEGFGFQWFFFSFLIWVHTKWLGTTVCHNHVSFLLYQPTCTSSILICIIWVLIFNTVSGPASEFANVSLQPVLIGGSRTATWTFLACN